ncbi:MAG: cob(I)yrinic acid a,c-diamide adenosyltransferase [Propionibacteriaceae bacterium]|jgi:cob(I)alamin adenosyltransferase|nr:cob(I)yrinic acid a,c-diamide adenosyltransferase [Propionibacteriaceae bacterium]
MVKLTRIYTRTGDAGKTRLSDGSATLKTDARVAAYGAVDEANCAIGVALALPGIPDEIAKLLALVQNELFDVGADLSNPMVPEPKWEPLRVIAESVTRLEHWCDKFAAKLPELKSFVLPSGTPLAAQLHVVRTLVRRAERAAWEAAEEYGLELTAAHPAGGINPIALRYLNRLSDLAFILARYANCTTGQDELFWVSGGERHSDNKK